MTRKTLAVTAIFVLTAAASAGAQSRSPTKWCRNHDGSIADCREIRNDTREIRADKRELGADRREIRHDIRWATSGKRYRIAVSWWATGESYGVIDVIAART